jgi:ubiquinone/menaquinone biosynthesis C-methylase UbiE
MSRFSASSPHEIRPETEGKTISWARRYDLVVDLLTLGRSSFFRARTADLARLSAGEAVLDIRCGTGDLTREVRRRVGPGALVAGIDAAPEMIKRARQKAERAGLSIDFRVEAVEAMCFADQTFDVVISSMMFHHLPGELKQRAAREARRVLKPDERLLIVDFMRSKHGFLFHRALHTGVQDLPPLLSAAGFLQVEWQPGPLPALGAVRGVTPQ